MPPSAALPRAPARVGPYWLDPEPVGRGGMSVVYRGVHDPSGREVAVKIANDNPWAQARMRREIDVQCRLDHAHVMPILRAADDASWFSMPYATASLHSLQVALRADPRRLRAALLEVVAGLCYAHGQGLVHRDLSPANVLRLANGAWVVADWGLVHGPAGGGPPLTGPGEGLGTARFTAPEVLKDAATATPDADAYSIGALAEWLLFGTRPRRRSDCAPAARPWWDLVRHTVCSELDDRWELERIRVALLALPHEMSCSPAASPDLERCPCCLAQAGFDGGARCLSCGVPWPSYA